MAALSLTEGDVLRLWRDPEAARQEIERYSSVDAARYQDFLAWVEDQASILLGTQDQVPPDLASDRYLPGLAPWSRMAIRLRRGSRL